MEVADNRGDGSAFAARRFDVPRLRRKILDEIFRNPIVDFKCVQECGREL